MKTKEQYEVSWTRAILSGMLGALAATTFMSLAFTLKLTEMNLPLLVGSIVHPHFSDTAWGIGVLLLILGGIPMGMLYATFFRWGHHINVGLGLILGLFQWMAAGFALGLIPPLNPIVPEQIPAPGLFGVNHEVLTWGLFLAANLLFGAVVTALEKARRRTSTNKPDSRDMPEEGFEMPQVYSAKARYNRGLRY